MNNDGVTMRVHKNLAKQFEEIKIERIRKGSDKKLQSDRRLSLAVTKHSLWKEIKNDIIEHTLKNE